MTNITWITYMQAKVTAYIVKIKQLFKIFEVHQTIHGQSHFLNIVFVDVNN